MLVATVPAELTVRAIGWRGLFVATAAVTAVVAAVIFVVVPEHSHRRLAEPVKTQLREIRTIFADSFFWRLAPVVALTTGTHTGGEFFGLEPRGGKMRMRAVSIYEFEGDRMTCEKLFFDGAMLREQLAGTSEEGA